MWASVPVGVQAIIRIIPQKIGWLRSEPIHVSMQSGPRIPQQFASWIRSGIFSVFVLGMESRLKTFSPFLQCR